MIGIDVNLDTLGGVTTILAAVAIIVGLLLLSGLYAIMLWVGIVVIGAIVLYFGGRRLYRYLDERFLSPDRPTPGEERWE